ncbi:MAG: hypothetical protein WB586_02410 [Chthoniobacterales bacterium]
MIAQRERKCIFEVRGRIDWPLRNRNDLYTLSRICGDNGNGVVALIARYLNRRAAFRVLAGLSVWFIYAGLLGYLGVVKNTAMRPPGIAFIVVPVFFFLFFFIVFIVPSAAGARLALAFPLWIILGTQSFRIGVELFLHQLWIDGLVPKMLTFAGANVDIYIGASAPLIAWCRHGGAWD